MPFETYATLLNRKIVLPSSTSNYVAIDRDYWIASLAARLAEVDLDPAWYARRYPDVAAAIEKQGIRDAMQHYCESGYFEHRLPYRIDVDSAWYVAQYPDVQAAIAQRLFGSAQGHFEETGYREGRHPFAGFALRKRPDTDPGLGVEGKPAQAGRKPAGHTLPRR